MGLMFRLDPRLAFRELEALTRTRLTVLLTFDLTRIAGKEPGFLQRRSQFRVVLHQRTRGNPLFLVVMIELGLITPPIGFNLFVLQGITGKPIPRGGDLV